ncbi:MAG: OmpA family protein [Desulfobacteraceae bacterium]|nr:OmpA family protein [Desulfobacteraceae bacterium]
MKKLAILGTGIFLVFVTSTLFAAGDPNDMQGSSDPALFTRMKGFYISNYQVWDFDRYEFSVGPNKTQAVEGRHVYVDYYANDSIKVPSAIQITRNYVNAAKAIGGEAIYEYEDGGSQYLTLKVIKDNAEAWAAIEAAGNGIYKIHVVEKQTMNQDVTANADSLASSITSTGKAAVYGIYFDTGKSEIKPTSEPALGEIAKLLKNDAKLKLYVVGHTDNVGAFDANIKLSQARAAAVVNALVKQHGIAAARLTPFGAGPTSPAAANTSDEGRAKNRRVELVAQ